MKDLEFKKIDEKDFVAFERQVSLVSFLQLPEMALLMRKNHWETQFVALLQDGKVQMAALLAAKKMTGGKHFEIKFGPLALGSDEALENYFYQELRNFVKNQGALELIVTPNVDFQHFSDDGKAFTSSDEHLTSDLEKMGYVHPKVERHYTEYSEPLWHYVKDLSSLSSEKDLLKSYNKTGKYSVALAQKYGLKVEALTYDELNQFKEITAATALRKGYPDRDLAYYQHVYQIFGEKAQFLAAKMNFAAYAARLKTQIQDLSEQIAQLTEEIAQTDSAKKKKQRLAAETQRRAYQKRLDEVKEFALEYGDAEIILAVALFIYSQGETVYLYSGSREKFKRFCAPFILQHVSMLESIQRKISQYNFFGISGQMDGSDGVLRYKENFAGFIVQKLGVFNYYPNPVKYRFIQTVKKLLGR